MECGMTKEHGRYLLLVEDNRDQREAMQAALEIEGYHVIAVPEGQEALDHLRRGSRGTVVRARNPTRRPVCGRPVAVLGRSEGA